MSLTRSAGAAKAGPAGLDALLASRGVRPIDFTDWRKIDQAEIAAADGATPRVKFVCVAEMLALLGRR